MAIYQTTGSDGLAAEVATIGTSAGAGDSDKIAHLDASGKFHISFMPTGIGQPTKVANAAEALSAGDWVYINSSGTVAKAVASSAATLPQGFVLSAVSSGASATVYLEGENNVLTGLTRNTRYFLSGSTPGATTSTAPSSGSGHHVFSVGIASETTAIPFKPQHIVKRTA